MARTATVIDQTLLVQAIEQAEANGALPSQNEVFEKASEAYNKAIAGNANLKSISPAVVRLRIEELNLIIQTPKGKRGRPAGSKNKEAAPVIDPTTAVTDTVATASLPEAKPEPYTKIEPAVKEIKAEAKEIKDEAVEGDAPEEGKRTKIIHDVNEKVKLSVFMAACHVLDSVRVGDIVTLNAPVTVDPDFAILSNKNENVFPFNASYSKVEIDKGKNTIAIWKVSSIGSPDVLIENVFNDMEDKDDTKAGELVAAK